MLTHLILDISFDPELRDSHTDNSTALEEIPFAEFHATNEREEVRIWIATDPFYV